MALEDWRSGDYESVGKLIQDCIIELQRDYVSIEIIILLLLILSKFTCILNFAMRMLSNSFKSFPFSPVQCT